MDEVVPVPTEATEDVSQLDLAAAAAATQGHALKTEMDDGSSGERLNALINIVSMTFSTAVGTMECSGNFAKLPIRVSHNQLLFS